MGARPMNGTSYKMLDSLWARLMERQKVTTRCARCEWVATGPLEEVRVQFTAHREREHPSVLVVLPNPRKKMLTSVEMRRAA